MIYECIKIDYKILSTDSNLKCNFYRLKVLVLLYPGFDKIF